MADPTNPQQALDAALAALQEHDEAVTREAELAAIQHPTASEREGQA